MNELQQSFLSSLTLSQAYRVLEKFNFDPSTADHKSSAAYVAFCKAWEMVNPGEYIQRRNLSGGVDYNYISTV